MEYMGRPKKQKDFQPIFLSPKRRVPHIVWKSDPGWAAKEQARLDKEYAAWMEKSNERNVER